MAVAGQIKGKFHCRRCRAFLFGEQDLSETHEMQASCSLWFVRDDDIVPWIAESINQANWTEGKLYCPKCEARIGAFDFLHLVTCGCQHSTQPAIYFVRSKVDDIRPGLLARSNVSAGKDGEKHDQPPACNCNKEKDGSNSGKTSDANLPNYSGPFSYSRTSDLSASNALLSTVLIDATCATRSRGPTGSLSVASLSDDANEGSGVLACPSVDVLAVPLVNEYEILEDNAPTSDFNDLLGGAEVSGVCADFLNFGHSELEETSFTVPSNTSVDSLADQAEFYTKTIDAVAGCMEKTSLIRQNVYSASENLPQQTFDTVPAKAIRRSDRQRRTENSTDCGDLVYDDIRALNLSGGVTEASSVACPSGIPLQPCPGKASFRSHRFQPHVLTCQACQSSYSNLFKSNRRTNPYLVYDYFELVSGDAGDDLIQSTSFSHDPIAPSGLEVERPITPNDSPLECRHVGCNCNLSASGAPIWPESEIQQELRQVQRELINLQGMIHKEMRRNGGGDNVRHRRPTRSNRSASPRPCSTGRDPRYSLHLETRGSSSNVRLAGTELITKSESASTCSCDRVPIENQDSDVAIPDRFLCSVCLDLLYDPHVTACQHVFCAPCLRQLHNASRRRPLCPLCRQRIYYVNPRLDIQDEVKLLYPELHRQRSVTEARRPVQHWPLPTFTNVRFVDDDLAHANPRYWSLVRAVNVIRASLVMLVLLVSYFLSGEERPVSVRFARNVRLMLCILIGLIVMFAGVGLAVICSMYAYELFKCLIVLIAFYVVVMLLMRTVIGADDRVG